MPHPEPALSLPPPDAHPGSTVEPSAAAQTPRGPSPAVDRALLVLFGAWMAARFICLALSPLLAVEAPALLVILSPTFTHLILTSALLPPAQFAPLAFGASALQVALGYTVGRRWGQVALRRITRRSATLRRWRGFVERAASWVVFLVPGPITCTTAGAVGLAPRGFYGPMLAGVTVWVAACFAAGGAFGDPIRAVVERAADHVVPLTAVAIALAAARWHRTRDHGG